MLFFDDKNTVSVYKILWLKSNQVLLYLVSFCIDTVESVFTEILLEYYLLLKQGFNSCSIEHPFS